MRTLIISLSLCLIAGQAYAETGQATYYTTKSCQREGTSGVFTASGERFNEQALTCALPWKPDNREYMVYGHKTGLSVVVRHNDFGPSKKCVKKGTIIDLTPKVFSIICGDLSLGKCEVSYQEIM
jgi:rare lipoprotein A (peptidoglycan hydrolase)